MTGTVHELHHIVRYDGFSPWSIPGSHVGSPLSLEPETRAAGRPPGYTSTQSSGVFLTNLMGRGGGGGGGGRSSESLPENLTGCLLITAASSPSIHSDGEEGLMGTVQHKQKPDHLLSNVLHIVII